MRRDTIRMSGLVLVESANLLRRKTRVPIVLVSILALILTACQESAPESGGQTTTAEAAAPTTQPRTTSTRAASDTTATSGLTQGQRMEINLVVDFFANGLSGHAHIAKQAGFFDKENLEVTINYIPSVGSARQVAAGGADIGYSGLTDMAVVRQVTGVDLVGIYSYQQTSPFAVIFKSDSGISQPVDLEGKTVTNFAGSSTQPLWPLFLERNGVDASQIDLQLVDPAARLSLVVTDDADAALGFWPDNVAVLSAACNCDAGSLKWDDYGLHHFGNGFVVRRDFLDDNSEAVAAFLRAITRELQFAADNPEEATGLLMEAAGDDVFGDPNLFPVQIENLVTQFHSSASDGQPLGWMAVEDWEATVDVMVAAGQMDPVGSVEELFTNEFVPAD
jgi:NitT/TauT family transport system substrate-binding protein